MGINISCGARSSAGYTLLELMVVVSIVGFMSLVAVPGVQDSMRRNAKESEMLDLMSAIALARSEAVTQSRPVTICRSRDGAQCAAAPGGGDWSAGWIIFTDSANPAGQVDEADGDTRLKIGPASDNGSIITLKNFANGNFAADFLQFNRDGSIKTAAAATGAYFKFCDSTNSAANARAILLANTGRSVPSTAGANGVHDRLDGADLTCP
jgi:type IV fimbrial biogenesis protein FimT